MFNMSTWSYPANPEEVDFDYSSRGTELLDPTGTQVIPSECWNAAGGKCVLFLVPTYE